MLKIYTTTQCAYCTMVKRFLDKKEVEYEIINLDENPDKRDEAFALSGVMSVPVTTNGTDVVVGFVPSKLIGLL